MNYELLGGALLAILAALYSFQKFRRDWKVTEAESNIISTTQEELKRLSAQNQVLSEEIGKLHLQIISLNKQLQTLTVENSHLQLRVLELTEEIGKFREMSGGR